jgi:trk system potassium uptake protein TrkA
MIIAVIGLGTFGAKTAVRLFEKGAEVLAIDSNPELVDRIKDRVSHAICIDVTQEKSLRAVNISDVDTAIVAIGDNIEMSIMAVAMLRKLGEPKLIVLAKLKVL